LAANPALYKVTKVYVGQIKGGFSFFLTKNSVPLFEELKERHQYASLSENFLKEAAIGFQNRSMGFGCVGKNTSVKFVVF
jgi:hypothetical protein